LSPNQFSKGGIGATRLESPHLTGGYLVTGQEPPASNGMKAEETLEKEWTCMKIILESVLEKYAWEVMMEAHRKWEKNYGDTLRDRMEWYFDTLYKGESEEAIRAEVDSRMMNEFGDDLTATEEKYISGAMSLAAYGEIDVAEREGLEDDFREEYRDLQVDIAEKREEITEDVKEELWRVYHTFFNAPGDLTVAFEKK
jgi:hypothetical protein